MRTAEKQSRGGTGLGEVGDAELRGGIAEHDVIAGVIAGDGELAENGATGRGCSGD